MRNQPTELARGATFEVRGRADFAVALDATRAALLATTALTGALIAAFANPHSALAACAGENTANVLCDAANPATAGTLNTTFPGSTLVTVNPGAAITNNAIATVTAAGTLMFNHNDPGGIGSGVSLTNNFGSVTFTGNAPVGNGGGGGIDVSAGSDGNVSVTANSAVSGAGTGIQVSNSGTGTSLVTGSGAIQGFFFSAIAVTATGTGPGAGVDGIHISGTGSASTLKNPAVAAQITNPANNSNILIDHSGTIAGPDGGVFATTAGGGNITVTTSNNVSAANGTAITTQVVSGTNTVNVTAGKVQGDFLGISAIASKPGGSNITISSGAAVVGDSAFGTGVALSGGNNTLVNNGTISGNLGVTTGSSSTTTIDNAGTIVSFGGAGVFFHGANNLFVMDGPLASLTGLALGSGSDTFRLAGSGANTFDVSQIGTGWTSFEKTGSSVWTLTGTATYAGPATVNAGTLLVNGSLASSSGLTVNAGATVGGTGTLPKTIINGGTLSPGSPPGNSIGTIAISGTLTFVGPGTYLVDVSPAASDQTKVSGNASLAGTVQVNAVAGVYTPKHYTILNAGSITGTFGSLVVNGSFGPAVKNPHLEYDANDVYFVLDPNAISPLLNGGTRNERAVAAAIDTALQAGVAIPPFLSLFNLTSAQLAGALDQLSGEVHASTTSLLLDESLYARSAVLGRLRQASYGGDARMASLAAGGPSAFQDGDELNSALGFAKSPVPTKAPLIAPAPSREVTFWAQGFGAWGRFDGDGNAAAVRRNLAGFFTGVDAPFGAGRAGIAAGYTASQNNLDGRGAADVETGHVAAYGGWSFGALNLRAGAASAWHTIDTNRTIAFPGFFDRLTSHYDGRTGQIFGEFGYGFAFRGIAIEPFAGAAWVDLHTGPAVERGGAAALNVAATSLEVGYSTLGIRAAVMVPLAHDMILVPRASLAWQHALGDVTGTATLAFQAAPAPFVIAGVPIARDAALAEAGLDLAIGRHATIGISYTGQLANNVQDHAAKGKFSWKF